jgi:protein-S-isoprenylcysteine O-methyltransferase Ste14
MKTTVLVDTGIYAIVRHPQGGTAGILFCLALALIGQHWLLGVLAVLTTFLLLADARNADRTCVAKFGEDYLRYKQRVPAVDFITGTVRYLANRDRSTT